jgi:beta-lactamase class A
MALLAFPATPAFAAVDVAPELRASLDAAVAEFSGDTAVVVSAPGTGFRYARRDDVVFPSASLYKLAVMVEAYRQAAARTISLDDTTVTVTWDDMSLDPSDTLPGTALTVRDAVERMITISDNGPAHALLRLLDPHNVNATAVALGMKDTRINAALPPEEQVVDYNTTSARDLELLFTGIAMGTVVNADASAEMLGVLQRQQINDRLPSGVPADASIAHKTGDLDLVSHDAGVVLGPLGPRVAVVLTRDFAAYGDVTRLAGRVASAAYTLPVDRLGAKLETVSGIALRAGDPATLLVTVTNTSNFTWNSSVRLASHWFDVDGRLLVWDGPRVALPPLEPGETTLVFATNTPPGRSGVYKVQWELVEDGVAWSGDAVSARVVLGAPYAAVIAP